MARCPGRYGRSSRFAITPSTWTWRSASHSSAFLQIAGERRQQQPLAASCFREDRLDGGAARLERELQKRPAGPLQQAVEQDQARGRLAGQVLDAAGGGMKAHLQGVERRCSLDRDNELSVQYERAPRKRSKVRHHFRKEPRQRLPGFRLDLELVSGPEREAPKPVPLGLELPARAVRQLRGTSGFHRLERQREAERGQVQGAFLCSAVHCCRTNRLMLGGNILGHRLVKTSSLERISLRFRRRRT